MTDDEGRSAAYGCSGSLIDSLTMGLILRGDNNLPQDPSRSQVICKGNKLFLIDVCCGLRE
jgi:hypothetical protein